VNKTSAVAEMGDRLAAIDMDRKVGAAVPLSWGGELGRHLTQCGLGRCLYLRDKFHLDPSNRLANIHKRCRQTDRTDNGPIA